MLEKLITKIENMIQKGYRIRKFGFQNYKIGEIGLHSFGDDTINFVIDCYDWNLLSKEKEALSIFSKIKELYDGSVDKNVEEYLES